MSRGLDVTDTGVAAEELKQFVERIEHMDQEAKAIGDDRKEIYAEARGRGFNIKVMKKIIAMRRMDHSERMEQEAILELYMNALKMQ